MWSTRHVQAARVTPQGGTNFPRDPDADADFMLQAAGTYVLGGGRDREPGGSELASDGRSEQTGGLFEQDGGQLRASVALFEEDVVELERHGVAKLLAAGFEKQTVADDEQADRCSKQTKGEQQQSVGSQEQSDDSFEQTAGCSKQAVRSFQETDGFFFLDDVEERRNDESLVQAAVFSMRHFGESEQHVGALEQAVDSRERPVGSRERADALLE
jgi:hypothetical protein